MKDLYRPPIVSLYQENKEVTADIIDPNKDLVVTWDGFSSGAAAPNGIIDDVIFVAASQCNLKSYAILSGLPFGDSDFLKYDAKEYRIKASELDPDRNYNLFVEYNDMVDTNKVGEKDPRCTFGLNFANLDPASCSIFPLKFKEPG